MGGMTVKHAVWYPDLEDVDQPNVWAATMAQSVADGIGDRLEKVENFVGANLSLDTSVLISSTTPTVMPYGLNLTTNFNEGMTVNANGSVTIPFTGLYQVNFNANFLGANTTASRINTYIFNNGATLAFSSTYGETVTSRYSNCNVAGVWKFNLGNVIDVRVSGGDSNTNLQAGAGSTFSMSLLSRQ